MVLHSGGPPPQGRVGTLQSGGASHGRVCHQRGTPSSSRHFWVFAFWMIFSVFQKNRVLGYSWSTLLWHRCYYPHRSRDALSPVCGISFYKSRNLFKFVSVLLSASVERVGVSRMRDFFLESVFFKTNSFSNYLLNGTLGTLVALMEAELQQLPRVFFGGFWALTDPGHS